MEQNKHTTANGKTITLIGPWLLVRPAPREMKTAGGIILTAGAENSASMTNHGEVVAVGQMTNRKDGGRYPIPGIKVGDHIVYIKYLEAQHTNEYIIKEFEGLVRIGPTDVLLVAETAEDLAAVSG